MAIIGTKGINAKERGETLAKLKTCIGEGG